MRSQVRGDRIQSKRKALGWSLRRLAEEVRADPVTLWRIERGLRTPKVDLFYKLAQALRLKPEELLR